MPKTSSYSYKGELQGLASPPHLQSSLLHPSIFFFGSNESECICSVPMCVYVGVYTSLRYVEVELLSQVGRVLLGCF